MKRPFPSTNLDTRPLTILHLRPHPGEDRGRGSALAAWTQQRTTIMRNRYPGRDMRAPVEVKVLGLRLSDTEYGSPLGLGFLFTLAVSDVVRRMVRPSWSIRSLSTGRGTQGEVTSETRTMKGEPLNTTA